MATSVPNSPRSDSRSFQIADALLSGEGFPFANWMIRAMRAATVLRYQSQFTSCVFLSLLSCIGTPIASGFNPPLQKQGPLTVRIESPTELDDAGAAFRTTVHLQNDGSETVSGQIRVHGIDGWQCLPNEAQAFEVAPRKTQSIEYQVTPSIESYAALYPLHAIATYDAQNTSYTAHPIQIIQLRKSRRPAVEPAAPWQPFAAVDNSTVSLWQLPATLAVVQVFDRPPVVQPTKDDGNNEGMRHFACGNYAVDILLGRRGLLDADFGFHDGTSQLWFRGFEVKVAGMQLDDPGSPITLDQASREPCDNGVRVRHRFLSVRGAFDLIGQATVADGRLRVHWQLENTPADEPWKVTRIESVSPGCFDSRARRVYAGHGNVIENPKAFQLNFDGHRLATSFIGLDFANELSLLQAVDLPPTKLVVDPERKVYAIHSSSSDHFVTG